MVISHQTHIQIWSPKIWHCCEIDPPDKLSKLVLLPNLAENVPLYLFRFVTIQIFFDFFTFHQLPDLFLKNQNLITLPLEN
jgi:hypothetical protein